MEKAKTAHFVGENHMNPHLKLAYEQGAMRSLVEAQAQQEGRGPQQDLLGEALRSTIDRKKAGIDWLRDNFDPSMFNSAAGYGALGAGLGSAAGAGLLGAAHFASRGRSSKALKDLVSSATEGTGSTGKSLRAAALLSLLAGGTAGAGAVLGSGHYHDTEPLLRKLERFIS